MSFADLHLENYIFEAEAAMRNGRWWLLKKNGGFGSFLILLPLVKDETWETTTRAAVEVAHIIVERAHNVELTDRQG